jgi:hypothetical protein
MLKLTLSAAALALALSSASAFAHCTHGAGTVLPHKSAVAAHQKRIGSGAYACLYFVPNTVAPNILLPMTARNFGGC